MLVVKNILNNVRYFLHSKITCAVVTLPFFSWFFWSKTLKCLNTSTKGFYQYAEGLIRQFTLNTESKSNRNLQWNCFKIQRSRFQCVFLGYYLPNYFFNFSWSLNIQVLSQNIVFWWEDHCEILKNELNANLPKLNSFG